MCLSLVFLNHSGGPVQKQIIMSVVKKQHALPYYYFSFAFQGKILAYVFVWQFWCHYLMKKVHIYVALTFLQKINYEAHLSHSIESTHFSIHHWLFSIVPIFMFFLKGNYHATLDFMLGTNIMHFLLCCIHNCETS